MNRENLLRLLDSLLAELEAMRGDIDEKDEASLNGRLKRAREGREIWWAERQVGEWGEGAAEMDIPETPGTLSRLFGIGRNPKTKSK